MNAGGSITANEFVGNIYPNDDDDDDDVHCSVDGVSLKLFEIHSGMNEHSVI